MRKGPLIVLVILLLLVISIAAVFLIDKKSYDDTKDENFCIADSDCAPASVCHPTECVPTYKIPNKSEVYCTSVCIPGTLDCGQGSCLCVNNKCKAVINKK